MSILSVRGQSFTTRVKTDSVVGTVNAETVQFSVDDSWKGLQVFAVFANTEMPEQAPVTVLLDETMSCAIPRQVLAKPGTILVGLLGKNGGDVVKPTMWLEYSTASEQVPPDGGVDPDDERTQDALDQMVELVQKAKETADNLQAAAEAGEFDGDPGPEGPPGRSPIIQNKTWWLWDVEEQKYKDTGILATGGGGGGVSSYNDLSDRPRIGGVLLEGDKTAEELNLQPKGDYAEKTDIPSKLPAPYTLTFAGAVETAYDGSQAVTVTIPTVAGPPGVSPTVATEEIDGGTRVTFTFKGGSETVDILDGITPNLNIGTVETLEPGTDATATITGTPENPLINLGIPRGQNGKTPEKGIDYFTDEEIQAIASQAAALVPGGGSSAPKLLVDYTTPEVANYLYFSHSDDGTPFDMQRMRFYLFMPSNTGSTNRGAWLRIDDGSKGDVAQYNYRVSVNSNTLAYGRLFEAKVELFDECPDVICRYSSGTAASALNSFSSYPYDNPIAKIGEVKFLFLDSSEILAGTRVLIWSY